MATYYWVGTGPWDNVSTTNWAILSGGPGGFGPPSGGDICNFDSGSGTGTCTIASTALCNNVTFDSASVACVLSGNVAFLGRITLTRGSLDLAGFSLSCDQFFSNNANVRSIAFGTNGKIAASSGGTTTVLSLANATNLTVTGSRRLELSAAASTGTRTVGYGTTGGTEANAIDLYVTGSSDTVSLSAGSAFRNIDFTGFAGTWANAAINLYGSLTISTGMTVGAGTGALTLAATSGTKTLTTAGKTLDFPITFNGIGGAFSFADALTQGSTRAFTITNGTVKLKNGVTSTVGAFATSGSNAKTLQSTVDGSQATLSQASGTVSASNLTIKDIAATGGATWNAYLFNGNVNGGNNSGWSFLTPAQIAQRAGGLSLRLGLSL